MEPTNSDAARTGVATNVVEAVVAILVLVIGVVVISSSRALGAGWTSDGPGAGYFPFYIGLILVHLRRWASSTRRCSARSANTEIFVDREQLKRVLSVLVPAAGLRPGASCSSACTSPRRSTSPLFMIVLGKYSPREERRSLARGRSSRSSS